MTGNGREGVPTFPGVQLAPGAAAPAPAAPAAQPPPAPARGKGPRVRLGSILKMSAGLAFVGIASFAAMTEGTTVASNNAVVSAYTSSVRAPIEGVVRDVAARVGDFLEQGADVGSVEDDRVNDQRLVDLRAQVERWRAEREAFEVQAAELEVISELLLRRVAGHALESREFLLDMVREARENRAAKWERAQSARREASRRGSLARSGFAAQADVDKLLAEAAALERETAALDARAAYLERQAMFAGSGGLVDQGGNDVPYSRQRADEVLIRLTEVRRAISSFASQEREASQRLSDEERRVSLLREAPLRTPSKGMVWRVSTAPGERVMRGATVLETVDCDSSFLIAAVAQDRFGDVRIGGRAVYRLSGEDRDRTAVVTAITGQASLADERNLAAAPLVQRSAVAMVRLSPERGPAAEEEGPTCPVGRTLRVLIPVRETGLMAWLTRFLD